ncbi:protein SENSITIVE TO PROTON RHIZOTOXICITY 1-like [Lotus japonicus]|uniref:protein SENSITIVE TO PROTON RHIZOTOXICITY 1-like n=1 Tax=Lotus japonicus TaxID=34305 RepID=UPI002586D164|nr:protein SENSITIVE TO PROTON RHIZOTOXICITY 1-like [Lotus japonicus]
MSNLDPDSQATTTRKLHPHEDPNFTAADPHVPLRNLFLVRTTMDSLHHFLSQSINTNSPLAADQITAVSNQIVSALHQTVVNGAALVSCSQNLTSAAGASVLPPTISIPEKSVKQTLDSKVEFAEDDTVEGRDGDWEIVELDAVELLAEHIHFCEICGKGFRRDANLRMHMRAHGNQFKTAEALAKPLVEDAGGQRERRFSCPFKGCNRNKRHRRFRALKSVVCVRNHFKRSHCPKMYACDRCHKRKSFSVLSDLKSHMRHCSESRWRCSCGTTFSRKDKLFGHIARFEGHVPAIALDEIGEKGKHVVEENEEDPIKEDELSNCFLNDDGLPEGFFDDFGSIDNYCLREVLGFPSSFK